MKKPNQDMQTSTFQSIRIKFAIRFPIYKGDLNKKAVGAGSEFTSYLWLWP
jgi:hypothetical protein